MPNREKAVIHREAKGTGSTGRMSQSPLSLTVTRGRDEHALSKQCVQRRGTSTLVNQSQNSIGDFMIVKPTAFGLNQDIGGDSCAVRRVERRTMIMAR